MDEISFENKIAAKLVLNRCGHHLLKISLNLIGVQPLSVPFIATEAHATSYRCSSLPTDYPGLEVRFNGAGPILLVGLHVVLPRWNGGNYTAESVAL